MLRRTKISLWIIFIVLLVFVFIYSNYRLYQPTVSQDSHLPLSDDVHVAIVLFPKVSKLFGFSRSMAAEFGAFLRLTYCNI
ncbi:hypothetical protein [Coxiella burnetii]|uniref:hypothetical protein n=1 Tax=Coxiella burnetii TaxID=777 RepID=UPI000AB428CB|nr:hypothetical protein [Coxiella burnetii]